MILIVVPLLTLLWIPYVVAVVTASRFEQPIWNTMMHVIDWAQ